MTDSADKTSGSTNTEFPFDVPPIEKSITWPDKCPTVAERYYTPRYLLNAGGIEGEDHCVLFHSNKICLVTLAPTHPVLACKKTVVKIDFQVSNNLDRSKNKVSGKGKHGAQFLQPTSLLCFIECSDESRYAVSSCVQGKLVEINENLTASPNLIVQKPNAEGYIAIILPNLSNSSKQKNELLSKEDYENLRKLADPVKSE